MDKWLETFAGTFFKRSAETAHDLKTPLNIAVLNLELLRIQLAKQADQNESRVASYIAAVDGELRRMAQIFDEFFLSSAPPREEPAPTVIDVAPIVLDVASSAGVQLKLHGPLPVRIHESRMRQALKLFLDGTFRLVKTKGRAVSVRRSQNLFALTVRGRAEAADFEPAKIFKFYFTDASGNPDLSLATARLIVETYGGELNVSRERDKVIFRLSLPQEIDETSSDR